MFDFFGMAGNCEERKVDRFEGKNGLMVDTCAVSDSEQPFETGIQHPQYNDGKWVIVQMYDTKEAAQTGHKDWVTKMTAVHLPESLTDVSSSTTARLCDVGSSDQEDWRNKQKA